MYVHMRVHITWSYQGILAHSFWGFQATTAGKAWQSRLAYGGENLVKCIHTLVDQQAEKSRNQG